MLFFGKGPSGTVIKLIFFVGVHSTYLLIFLLVIARVKLNLLYQFLVYPGLKINYNKACSLKQYLHSVSK